MAPLRKQLLSRGQKLRVVKRDHRVQFFMADESRKRRGAHSEWLAGGLDAAINRSRRESKAPRVEKTQDELDEETRTALSNSLLPGTAGKQYPEEYKLKNAMCEACFAPNCAGEKSCAFVTTGDVCPHLFCRACVVKLLDKVQRSAADLYPLPAVCPLCQIPFVDFVDLGVWPGCLDSQAP